MRLLYLELDIYSNCGAVIGVYPFKHTDVELLEKLVRWPLPSNELQKHHTVAVDIALFSDPSCVDVLCSIVPTKNWLDVTNLLSRDNTKTDCRHQQGLKVQACTN